MLKKIFIIGLLSSLIVLYWCGEKAWFQYEFDSFCWIFNTEKDFEIGKKNLTSLWYNILANNIVQMYVEKNPNSVFTDSIIVTKKNSDKSVESFWKENIEDVNVPKLKISKWKNFEIKCENGTYNLLYYQWKYGMNQYDLYLTYWFFKVGNEIYIISYATLDETSRNNFSSSFKTLTCK